MTKRINSILFFLFVVIVCHAKADSAFLVTHDTLKIQERRINQVTLEKFKADPAFQYGRPQEGISPWQRFLFWLLSMVGKLLFFVTQTWLGRILFYTMLGGILLWVILKLLNIDARDLFYRSNAPTKINYNLTEENIHELDFDKLIETAVQKNEYRSAVRLTFLYALKKLSDANAIHWLPGKTNDDYLNEIKIPAASPRLQELRYYFDYTWYGHFEVNENTYEEVKRSFEELKSQLR
jgi:hypothetical protein